MKQAFEAFLDAKKYSEAYGCLKILWNESRDYRAVEEYRCALRNAKVTRKILDLYRMSYDLTARDIFDDFMLALEWDRPQEQQFWLPRRAKLLKVCNALQDLADDKIDELFLNMPPRVGKSTIVMFFILWWMLKYPEEANLYTSYSDTVTDVFYTGVLEVLNDPTTYRWQSIFPGRRLVSTDSKNHLLNIDREKKYASFTARSLYGTLNGACDCSPGGIEIADDLHSGIEEALNKARLDTAWARVDNNFLPRAKPNTKNLWIGTRWSLYDCVGRRLDLLENDPKYGSRRFVVINMPALNDKGESNFEYDFGVGFSKEYYEMRKASFMRSDDLASWEAQYQNHPIERTGTVFLPESLRYYNGVLPEDDPDGWMCFVDPAWGGGDFVAGAIIARYDNDLYLHDVVFNNGDKKVTQPEVVNKAIKWECISMYIEGTRVTASYAEGVQKIFDLKGYKINLNTTTKHWSGQSGKAQRIFDLSPDIKDHVIFRDEHSRSPEYQKFMENLFGFKIEGKTKHDDAPDVLAIAITMIFNVVQTTAILRQRPF